MCRAFPPWECDGGSLASASHLSAFVRGDFCPDTMNSATSPTSHHQAPARVALTLGALGVVFGDIGTSPLYTMKECLAHLPAGVGREAGVLGVLSLMFWTLVFVVCVKYVTFITRADNRGEGGIFALLALLHQKAQGNARQHARIIVMMLIGAALLYGDGILTPAISVLGAAEGLTAISGKLEPFVVIFACAILAALFWIQRRGTMRIGRIFGPVMLVWFITLGLLGGWHLVGSIGVLKALNPLYGLALLRHNPLEVAALLGAVVLVITGAEALYADMGHFGRRQIAFAWYGVAFPGLVLNYFGQGALVLAQASPIENPFFALVPPGIPRAVLTVLSVAAAIIASQALISGCFSLTRQAIQLGYFPRLRVQHTHADHPGQIYLPFVNVLLAIGSILTVAFFGSTAHLSAAYGIAVTGTMAVTTVGFFLVSRRVWHRPLWWAAPWAAAFLIVDLAFLGSNAHKIHEGGWFPLVLGLGMFIIMYTWRSGRATVFAQVQSNPVTEDELVGIARSTRVTRVPGAAVFMVGSPQGTPVSLLHHVKSTRSLHQTVLLLSIVTDEVPATDPMVRLQCREIGAGVWRVVGHFGYMESPDVALLMDEARERGVPVSGPSATYFFNREIILPGGDGKMWEWQKNLYSFLSRVARPARDYYHIPPSQIIEIGLPIHI
jgi:KUP system potassium uptake protein